MRTSRTSTFTLTALLIACSGLGIANPEKQESSEKDLLKGPTITTTESNDSSKDSMTSKSDKKREKKSRDSHDQRERRAHPAREFQGALKALMSGKSKTEFSITDEQRDQIREIMSEQREAIAEFRKEHQEEIKELREQLKEERKAMREIMMEAKKNGEKIEREPSKAQQRMQELMSGSSLIENTLTKIKAVLTPEQLEQVKAQAKDMRENQRARTRKGPSAEHKNGEEGETEKRARPQRKKMNPDDAQRSRKNLKRKGKPAGNSSSADD